MPKLNDLFTDLNDLSTDQLRDRIRKIRADRRISKEPRKARKSRVTREAGAKSKAEKLLANMSEEEREAFLKELEGD